MPVVASWDFAARRIYMGVAEWHPYDIYVEHRAYRRLNEEARKFDPLMVYQGNIPKGGGKATPRYMLLLDGTKIVPLDGAIAPVTNITGEVFADDESDFIDVSTLTVSPRINYSPPSAEIIIKLAQAQLLEHSSFNGGVSIDTNLGSPGTAFPKGTPGSPVDNLADAKIIAAARGFNVFFVRGVLTLAAGESLAQTRIVGAGAFVDSISPSIVVFEPGCITNAVLFENIQVRGEQNGLCAYVKCVLVDLENTQGSYDNCVLVNQAKVRYYSGVVGGGLISLNTLDFINCRASYGQFVIDCNNSSLDYVFSNFTGRLKLTNLTNTNTSVTIMMDAGEVELDSSCTAGSITVSGIGKLTDNSSGSLTIDNSGLITLELLQQSSFEDKVTIDQDHGISGTAYPAGTPKCPVNNIEDALTIALGRGFRTLNVIHGTITLTSDHDVRQMLILGRDGTEVFLAIQAGALIEGTIFDSITLSGDHGGQHTRIRNSTIDGASNLCSIVTDSTLKGVIGLAGNRDVSFVRCYDGVNPGAVEVNLGGAGRKVEFRDYFGGLKISNKTGPEECTINFGAGRLAIAADVTGGSIVTRGVGEITVNLGTATISDSGLLNSALIGSGVTAATVLGADLQARLASVATVQTTAAQLAALGP